MKPWVLDKSWFEQYALGTVILKSLGANNQVSVSRITNAVRTTFMKVYRAVAFDIDGTLTEKNGVSINIKMALVVGELLQRGVPVILITGRGRTATRDAAEQIRDFSGLSDWYLRRLQCITHNGVMLLQTPPDNPSAFLRIERTIEEINQNIPDLVKEVQEAIHESQVPLSEVGVSPEPNSVRLVVNSEEVIPALEKSLRKLVNELQNNGKKLYLSRGSYAALTCFDISGTNKNLALDFVGKNLGIESDRILRIGDQGQEGGNDYDLLNSASGFSVGQFSSSLNRCYPVLDDDFKTHLNGVEATRRLLNLVMLFPPLSIAPTHNDERIRAHRTFEKLAIIRSREENETVTQRLRVRLRYLLPDATGFANPHTLEIDDIYDMRSGGVKFREWEFDELPENHTALKLFGVPRLSHNQKEAPKAQWCVYTDTGILMRGPFYYFGQAVPLAERTLPHYLKVIEPFITEAGQVIFLLSQEEATLTKYKLALAIQDNIRNILLQLLYIAFSIEGEAAVANALNKKLVSDEYIITRLFFAEAVVAHTRHHFDLLLNADSNWSTLLISYRSLLRKLSGLIGLYYKSLIPEYEDLRTPRSRRSIGPLFKWRECDNFLQNITAVQLGLHELHQRTEIRQAKRLAVVGLAYGGLELPAIAQVVATARGIRLDAALAKVSIYGNPEAGQKIRAGKYQYVSNLLDKTKPLCIMDKNRSVDELSFILMDDNCTTGVTLQLARDFLVMQGADVVGAIVVRFPGANRAVQMSMRGHGFPDPEVLFSFIRGLVAPSPYTRLIYPKRGKDPYLDQTRIFDKAKERIARYLLKNGTPMLK